MFPSDDAGQLGAWHLHSKFIYNLEDKEKKLTLGKVRQTRYTRIGRLGRLGQPITRQDCSRMLSVCREIAAWRSSRSREGMEGQGGSGREGGTD